MERLFILLFVLLYVVVLPAKAQLKGKQYNFTVVKKDTRSNEYRQKTITFLVESQRGKAMREALGQSRFETLLRSYKDAQSPENFIATVEMYENGIIYRLYHEEGSYLIAYDSKKNNTYSLHRIGKSDGTLVIEKGCNTRIVPFFLLTGKDSPVIKSSGDRVALPVQGVSGQPNEKPGFSNDSTYREAVVESTSDVETWNVFVESDLDERWEFRNHTSDGCPQQVTKTEYVKPVFLNKETPVTVWLAYLKDTQLLKQKTFKIENLINAGDHVQDRTTDVVREIVYRPSLGSIDGQLNISKHGNRNFSVLILVGLVAVVITGVFFGIRHIQQSKTST